MSIKTSISASGGGGTRLIAPSVAYKTNIVRIPSDYTTIQDAFDSEVVGHRAVKLLQVLVLVFYPRYLEIIS